MVATDKNKRVLILVVRLHAECHLKIRLHERVLCSQTVTDQTEQTYSA